MVQLEVGDRVYHFDDPEVHGTVTSTKGVTGRFNDYVSVKWDIEGHRLLPFEQVRYLRRVDSGSFDMVELEVGKYYKTHDGRMAGPVEYSGEFLKMRVDGCYTSQYYRRNGKWGCDETFGDDEKDLDIVEVWTNSTPAPSHHIHPAATSGAQREKLGALPYDLVPFQEIADAYSRVAEKGAVKYAPWNWSAGLARVQLIGSLLRHTWAYLRGEECDKETGLNHTDHILWNAVALAHNVRWNLEDGRRGEPERNYKNPLDKASSDD